MLLVIDNYDSFTYNLVQLLRYCYPFAVEVVRNDQLNAVDIAGLKPRALVLSPGPGRVSDSGCTLAAVDLYKGTLPIFGVCLGHQAIAASYGGDIILADHAMHGKTSAIFHDNEGIFTGLPACFHSMRYHSLVVNKKTLPGELCISATTHGGEIMGVRHRVLPIEGVQFHPESILSEYGKELVSNFIREYVLCS